MDFAGTSHYLSTLSTSQDKMREKRTEHTTPLSCLEKELDKNVIDLIFHPDSVNLYSIHRMKGAQ